MIYFGNFLLLKVINFSILTLQIFSALLFTYSFAFWLFALKHLLTQDIFFSQIFHVFLVCESIKISEMLYLQTIALT